MSGNRRKIMFRDAMSRWPAGVSVVTVPDGDEFRPATVSSFTSLSVDPPQVVVSLKSDSRVLELAQASGTFYVSVLADDQQEISDICASYDSSMLPGPHVPQSLGIFTCTVVDVLVPSHGTHCVLVGKVDTCAADLGRRPLLYWNRAYRRVL